MKNLKRMILAALLVAPATVLLTASHSGKAVKAAQVAHGKYLVSLGGCNDCHTPLKLTDKGPQPNFDRLLSGHPETTKLPTPDLKPGPWFVTTAGMTAWAGPWGITYTANLTPDTNTGLGIWTEDMFIKAMKTGKHMGSGRDILPPMPWQSLAHLTDDDLKAVYQYLRTIPSVVNRVPSPIPPGGKASFE